MVEWTFPARADLRSIHDYIALDSVFYAKNTIRRIIERASKLEVNPEIGHAVPELDDPKIREILMYSYRIIYQILPDRLAVLTVVHGSRDLRDDDIPVVR